MNYKMDKKFTDYFQKNLRQIFFYLIDDCNLRCVQCLYKQEICFQVEKKEVDFNDAVKLLEDFREMGAIKLTLMGGEPTLYDIKNDNKNLLALIKKSKELGYEYVRIDTNGQFKSELLEKPEFKMLDESLMDEQNYIIAKKGNTDMIEKMNTCIKKFLASDDYAKLCKKYDLSPLETK